ncbi:tRNA A-37 threonylcarbamoyl transferase component Bud32 [Nonomuraea thailandensis]|uniref:non-specific serine/threonine protein kinase n=1 Tax=Nonomuraea thailandensis TaxID=1188745 RepID=A0A9X2GPS7_9ACTN|nr:serine/threonine-protein kinase [Nonomuraea thailandensis]MCP2362976.1 tRNA A-37 threonylcarbamoyl transferase component Bud32 [Nonomuraea thailandensis]
MTLLAGRYRLLAQLGQGGMGTVWRAMDELLRQEVAIKEVRLPPDLDEAARAELTERTLREARAAAALRDHPSIVTVHDVVLDDGRPWIVMELVRGRSLDRAVRDEGPLPPARVAGIGLRMIEALSAAHATGILHRDVKPANVMLTDDGRVLLTDFGIATIAGDVALTQTGLLSGSPGYIAPERLRGETDGPPADLWSLGATLFTAVEGGAPFARHNEAAVLAAVLMQEPAPFRLAGPLGPALAAILEKDPARRCSPEQATAWLAAIAQGDHPTGGHSARMAGGHGGRGAGGHTGHTRDRGNRSAGTVPGRQGPPFPGPEPATQAGRPRRRRTKVLVATVLALVLTVTAGVVIVPRLFPNAIRLIGYALAPRSTPTPSPKPSVTRSTPAPQLVGAFEACDLLTNAQVRSLFGHTVKRHWMVESACSWRGGDFQVLSLTAHRGPSASMAALVHKQTVSFMQDEPKRTPGTKVRKGPAVGDEAYSHTGPTGLAWAGTPIHSTKVAFMVANVSVTLQIQGGGRGFGTADKAAELVEAALVKRKQAAGTG